MKNNAGAIPTYLCDSLVCQVWQDLHGQAVGFQLQSAAVQPVSKFWRFLSWKHIDSIFVLNLSLELPLNINVLKFKFSLNWIILFKKTCDYFHIEYQAHLSEFDEQSKMWLFKD